MSPWGAGLATRLKTRARSTVPSAGPSFGQELESLLEQGTLPLLS